MSYNQFHQSGWSTSRNYYQTASGCPPGQGYPPICSQLVSNQPSVDSYLGGNQRYSASTVCNMRRERQENEQLSYNRRPTNPATSDCTVNTTRDKKKRVKLTKAERKQFRGKLNQFPSDQGSNVETADSKDLKPKDASNQPAGQSKSKKRKFSKKAKEKDGSERVQFLYQAAHKVLKEPPHSPELARCYIKCLLEIKRKKVMRLDRQMEESICKRCNMLLIPGITQRIRISGDKRPHIVRTCLSCHKICRAIPPGRRKLKRKKKKVKKSQSTDSIVPDEPAGSAVT